MQQSLSSQPAAEADGLIRDPAVLHKFISTLPETESVKPDWRAAPSTRSHSLSSPSPSRSSSSPPPRTSCRSARPLLHLLLPLPPLPHRPRLRQQHIHSLRALQPRPRPAGPPPLLRLLHLVPRSSHRQRAASRPTRSAIEQANTFNDHGTYDDSQPVWAKLADYVRSQPSRRRSPCWSYMCRAGRG